MDDIKAIERYLIGRYLQETDISLAEVPQRRDAFLYLAQREELAVMGCPLYQTEILAGNNGPVFPALPTRSKTDYPPTDNITDISYYKSLSYSPAVQLKRRPKQLSARHRSSRCKCQLQRRLP